MSCYHGQGGLPRKQVETEELSTILLGYMINKHPNKWGGNQRLRVLFDSGCGATLINKKFVKHWKNSRDKSTKWSAKADIFKTTRECSKIEFTLPAFHANRSITCG